MKTFEKSPIYMNPKIGNDFTQTSADLEKMASSVGLELEWSGERLFVAILNPDKSAPEAWGVLASPLTPHEVWHWLNAYAVGRASKSRATSPTAF